METMQSLVVPYPFFLSAVERKHYTENAYIFNNIFWRGFQAQYETHNRSNECIKRVVQVAISRPNGDERVGKVWCFFGLCSTMQVEREPRTHHFVAESRFQNAMRITIITKQSEPG